MSVKTLCLWSAHHSERLVKLIKAFHGDVFGESLAMLLVSKKQETSAHTTTSHDERWNNNSKLRCRVSPEHIRLFLAVLRIDYMVHQNESQTCSCYVVRPKHPQQPQQQQFGVIELHIVVMNRRDWYLSFAELDVDMIANDMHRLYVRTGAPARLANLPEAVCDPLTYIIGRLQHKQFALLDSGRTIGNNLRIMDRAYRLVQEEGWTMDDTIIGCRGWLVCRFFEVHTHRPWVRANGDTCSLCLEIFKDEDIVVNLCCGHTFHYLCPPSTSTISTPTSTPDDNRNHNNNNNDNDNNNNDNDNNNNNNFSNNNNNNNNFSNNNYYSNKNHRASGLCTWLAVQHNTSALAIPPPPAAVAPASINITPPPQPQPSNVSGSNTCPYCRAII